MTAFVILAVFTLIALVYVTSPFRGDRRRKETRVSPVVEAAREKKRLALTAIVDIDDENEAGKLAEPDHRALRVRYEREALAALRELEYAKSARDAEVEEEIARVKKALACPVCGAVGGSETCSTCGPS